MNGDEFEQQRLNEEQLRNIVRMMAGTLIVYFVLRGASVPVAIHRAWRVLKGQEPHPFPSREDDDS